MEVEAAIKLVNQLLTQNQQEYLTTLQTEIFRKCWQGESYKEIANQSENKVGYQYIKDVGCQLWKVLSKILGEDIKKSNFKVVLERRLLQFSETSNLVNRASNRRHQDWGNAPDIEPFYGRVQELTTLEEWIINDQCRLVTILGLGGMGKTSLAVKLAQQIQTHFDYVIWHSLRYAPPIAEILAYWIKFLSNQTKTDLPEDVNQKIFLLITEYLQKKRCLLILDSINTVLDAESCSRTETYQQECQEYSKLLSQIITVSHQSCLLLTSQDKPQAVIRYEANNRSVNSLPIQGLQENDALNFFRIEEFPRTPATETDLKTIIKHFGGSPLVLEQIPRYIQEVLYGDLDEYMRALRDGELRFEEYTDVLNRQFERLSQLEKGVMYWLAINREPIQFEELIEDLVPSSTKIEVRGALNRLGKGKLMIEETANGFTLLPSIMDYLTDSFVCHICQEIIDNTLLLFNNHCLLKSSAKNYIKNAQIRFIIQPIKHKLLEKYGLWDTQTLKCLDTIPGHTDCVRSISFSPNSKKLISGSNDYTAKLWDVETGQCLNTFQGHLHWIRTVTFNHDGTIVATGSPDQTIRLWDVMTGQCLKIWQGYTNWIRSVQFSHDGQTIASISTEHTIRRWNISSLEPLEIEPLDTFYQETDWLNSLRFSPDDKYFALGSTDKIAKILLTSTGQCINKLKGHEGRILQIAFHPHGKILATANDDKKIKLWDFASETCLHTLSGYEKRVRCVSFNSDGTFLASGGEDFIIKIWKLETEIRQSDPNPYRSMSGHQKRICSIAFSSNNLILASGSSDRSIKLWDIANGTEITTLTGHNERVLSIQFNPQNPAMLASASEDTTVNIWDINTGEYVTLPGHEKTVTSVSFHPQGNLLASASHDETIRLWDVKTYECVEILSSPKPYVNTNIAGVSGLSRAEIASLKTLGAVERWD